MDRSMLAYLPPALRGYREFQAIAAGQQALFSALWQEADQALDNQFLDTAGLWGVARWEELLGIQPKGTETLEERRFRVKARVSEQLPFTLAVLRRQLESLCGPGAAQAELQGYTLRVRLALSAGSRLQEAAALLERTAPAHLVIDLDLKRNPHRLLAGLTHGELAAYTQENLRNEVISHAESDDLL